MAAGKMEVLLVVIWLHVDRSAENQLVNIKEGDMRDGDFPGKSERIVTAEVLKEKKIMAMSPQQEDNINKHDPKVRFRVF